MKTEYKIRLGLILVLTLTAFFAVLPSQRALAGDCDGTSGDDDGISNPIVLCTSDPAAPDDVIGLDLGDDALVLDPGVTADFVSGDGLGDGTGNTGDGGNDTLTISGDVSCVDGDNTDGNGGNDTITITSTGSVSCTVAGDDVSGDGGNDVIVVDGSAFAVSGDYATNGGNDNITINGGALIVFGDEAYGGDGGDDTIMINGFVGFAVLGDGADGDGGDDTITVNGVVYGDVVGDGADGDGGDDTILINGEVDGGVFADEVIGVGGNDTVIIGSHAIVVDEIDGEDGFDILKFAGLRQSQLAGLDPANDSITVAGQTYTWFNFERLIGLLQELASGNNGLRVIYQSQTLIAVDQLDGLAVFTEHGRIAFITFSSLDFGPGGSQTYTTPNGAGWYVVVTNTGPNPDNHSNTLYQVEIFDASGTQQAQFSFSN